jgi:hypothetical protein
MKRLLLTALSVVLGLALVPSVASGKGPSEASIEGPGLSGSLSLPGGEANGPLGDFIMSAGFFPAVFGQSPDPMLDARPQDALGPRYVVTYVMPGPNGEEDVLRQDVYPYAKPDPLTYVEPGQRFWGTEETHGGWFVGLYGLKGMLVEAGLPATAPAAGVDEAPFPWTLIAAFVVLGALFVLVLGALTRRRRPQAAATS